ncbi:MAG: 50S ribosomal protein L29 [Gammaproteobacteria bacterium]|nr:50S ribosomal protein L29 [Gammaproteobacteria bacterium]
MRTSELRELNVEELESKLLEFRKEQFKLRIRRSTGSLEKFHEFGNLRKAIARTKTILTQKQSEVHSD